MAFVALAIPLVFYPLGLRPVAPRRSQRLRHARPARPPEEGSFAAMLADARYRRRLAIFLFLELGVSGYVLHLIPMLTDAGMPAIKAAGVQARLGSAVIVGRLAVGAAVDYFFAPRVAALSLRLMIAAIVALGILGPSVAPLWAFAIGYLTAK